MLFQDSDCTKLGEFKEFPLNFEGILQLQVIAQNVLAVLAAKGLFIVNLLSNACERLEFDDVQRIQCLSAESLMLVQGHRDVWMYDFNNQSIALHKQFAQEIRTCAWGKGELVIVLGDCVILFDSNGDMLFSRSFPVINDVVDVHKLDDKLIVTSRHQLQVFSNVLESIEVSCEMSNPVTGTVFCENDGVFQLVLKAEFSDFLFTISNEDNILSHRRIFSPTVGTTGISSIEDVILLVSDTVLCTVDELFNIDMKFLHANDEKRIVSCAVMSDIFIIGFSDGSLFICDHKFVKEQE
ncbi:hypothetical protein PCE1_001333 [Barthelona sp. PCE]